MDLMEKLKGSARISTKKRVDKRLIYALGLLGILMPAMAVWLTFSDMRSGGVISEAREEGHQAVDGLMQPIQVIFIALSFFGLIATSYCFK